MLNGKGFQLQGKAMRMLRINGEKTTPEVAEALGVSRAFIAMCEGNTRKLSTSKTKRFLGFFGMTEEEAKLFVQIVGRHESNQGRLKEDK